MLRVRTLGACEIAIGNEQIGPEQRTAFVLIFLIARRGQAGCSRRELASLLWPDARDRDQNHRLRSLLHRLRRLGVPIVCAGATITISEVTLDVAEFARAPRSLADVRALAPRVAFPVLPNLELTSPATLADRVEHERDVIIATVIRWLRMSLDIAKSAGDWRLVESLALSMMQMEQESELAALCLAEAQLLTSGSAAALRTLDEYTSRCTTREPSLPVKLLRQRIGSCRVTRATPIDDLPLIGRDQIMLRIWSAVARARDGYGGAILVWGPAGIGKSRVLREVERVRLIDSVRVVRLTTRPIHALQASRLLVELIARLLDEPGAVGCDPAAFARLREVASAPNGSRDLEELSPDRCFDDLSELLAALADEATTLVLIDDMHVVDSSIWRFLSALFRWSVGRRIHWVLGYRALRETELASLSESSLLHRHRLTCLARADAAKLVDAARHGHCPLDFDEIFRYVGGHPALLAALARSESTLPRWTEPVVDDWITRIDGNQRRILQALGSLGGSTPKSSLAALGLTSPDMTAALDELGQHGVIHVADGVVSAYRIWTDAAHAHSDSLLINATMIAF